MHKNNEMGENDLVLSLSLILFYSNSPVRNTIRFRASLVSSKGYSVYTVSIHQVYVRGIGICTVNHHQEVLDDTQNSLDVFRISYRGLTQTITNNQ